MTSTYAFRSAAGADYGKVIDLWMRGVSSDRVAIDQIANTWWKRLLFRYVAGRKIFQQDMETAVVLKDGNLCGYYGLQTAADTMSVFDWGLDLDWNAEGLNVFGLMVEHILDDIYERNDDIESLVIGTERHEHDVRAALEQSDFEPLDYQIAQMVIDLPLAHNEPRGEMDLHLTLRNAHSFGDAMEDWIRMDYQGDKRKAAIVLPSTMRCPCEPSPTRFSRERSPRASSSSHPTTMKPVSCTRWSQDCGARRWNAWP